MVRLILAVSLLFACSDRKSWSEIQASYGEWEDTSGEVVCGEFTTYLHRPDWEYVVEICGEAVRKRNLRP